MNYLTEANYLQDVDLYITKKGNIRPNKLDRKTVLLDIEARGDKSIFWNVESKFCVRCTQCKEHVGFYAFGDLTDRKILLCGCCNAKFEETEGKVNNFLRWTPFKKSDFSLEHRVMINGECYYC